MYAYDGLGCIDLCMRSQTQPQAGATLGDGYGRHGSGYRWNLEINVVKCFVGIPSEARVIAPVMLMTSIPHHIISPTLVLVPLAQPPSFRLYHLTTFFHLLSPNTLTYQHQTPNTLSKWLNHRPRNKRTLLLGSPPRVNRPTTSRPELSNVQVGFFLGPDNLWISSRFANS